MIGNPFYEFILLLNVRVRCQMQTGAAMEAPFVP